MSFSAAGLADTLGRLEQSLLASGTRPSRYLIALSGGLDSVVLAHSVAKAGTDRPVHAVHVNHGLHRNAAEWADHCVQVAAEFGIECTVLDVTVGRDGGPEAAARLARYAAIESAMSPGDWLLSAHHREDQAETLLLNLLRGSGPTGIAGIPRLRRFGPGMLARPLLDVPREELRDYADKHALRWIDDPSNDESEFDRNYLRHDVFPLLDARWPNAAARLAASADLAREASDILVDIADFDLANVAERPDRLYVQSLAALSRPRQANAIRRAAQLAGLTMPGRSHVDEILTQTTDARDDALPVVAWPGGEARRYRAMLYLLPGLPLATFDGETFEGACDLGPGMGRLELTPGKGLSADCVSAGLSLRVRQGGEKIKPVDQEHTKKIKKLLQERGVVPWMRERVPLVYSGERLVAVADLWTEASVTVPDGTAIRWRDRPALD
ncbi:MAG: tRNA lysidine(34) synthetase TilS [Woeseiaceae bacterium]|nr:tRNA lysidine(34) synthetase TilS [Woeseiaceae bacterium]